MLEAAGAFLPDLTRVCGVTVVIIYNDVMGTSAKMVKTAGEAYFTCPRIFYVRGHKHTGDKCSSCSSEGPDFVRFPARVFSPGFPADYPL